MTCLAVVVQERDKKITIWQKHTSTCSLVEVQNALKHMQVCNTLQDLSSKGEVRCLSDGHDLAHQQAVQVRATGEGKNCSLAEAHIGF